MATIGILTEKPSAARNFAKALGGMSGTHNGEDYVIVSARGHLFEFKDPSEMVPADMKGRIKGWDLSGLPWDEAAFNWTREKKKGVSSLISDINKTLSRCTTVVIASDIDPTGEGDLLAWEIIDELDLHDKVIERMEFVDESETSIRKAFGSRRPVTSMLDEGDYRKAAYRSQFDLLSMQWTRVATKTAEARGYKALLRNGRLKSAMVRLVGEGLDAHLTYKKVPFFQNRFRDDKGVVYTYEEEPRFASRDQVPTGYEPSPVELYESKDKRTAPPRLLDLAGLSAMLSKENIKADQVLKTYQKMYEAQVVSYPRTEDKFVTPEQFTELLPKIDAIAAVVGVDPGELTQRSPRGSHVKKGGAHGANRPGLNVPASLAAVESTYGRVGLRIYEILARNYLTMLAEDYTYRQQKGRLTRYLDFTGVANVPLSLGWKGIFSTDDEEEGAQEEGGETGLGTQAEPFIHEGAPPRPPHPSMTWLMKQLEKHEVGTGATRTSTYAEVSKGGPSGLLVEKRGKITMTDAGELNYRLLPGTHIGDLSLTEKVQANMAAIAAGTLTAEEALRPVRQWVTEDMETMSDNARKIPTDFGKKLMTGNNAVSREYYHGEWKGSPVKFNRSYGGHRFTDEECQVLCDDGTVTISGTVASTGKPFTMTGALEQQTFTTAEGKKIPFVGFAGEIDRFANVDPAVHAVGMWEPHNRKVKFKRTWGGHSFTDDEIADLLAGKTITFTTTFDSGNSSEVTGTLEEMTFTSKEGREITYVGFKAGVNLTTHAVGVWKEGGKGAGREVKFKRSWSGHDFTDEEIADLLAGKSVTFEATFRSGKKSQVTGKLENKTYQGKPFVGFEPDFSKKN